MRSYTSGLAFAFPCDMTAVSSDRSSRQLSVFELKSASLPLLALLLKTADLQQLGAAFDERFGGRDGLFEGDPVVVDLSALPDDEPLGDVEGLLTLLQLCAVAVRGGTALQRQAVRAAGLAEASDLTVQVDRSAAPPPEPEAAAVAVAPPATLIVDRPLRSGQQVYARGGDLVVMAAVNFGAEVMADGSIHVYAPLRGRAVAGARGHAQARIISTCMEPQLVSIAGTYRTIEEALPAEVAGRPAQVRLDGDRLTIEPLGR
jgi:septum site-determining protein MinC